jgi:hypothetical protein
MESDPRPSRPDFDRQPKIGDSVTVGGKPGVVCAPDDPGRSGTYTSAKYGPIPIKLQRRGNRAERRKAHHDARRKSA